MAIYKNILIDKNFLDSNPNAYFVFGDNLIRIGKGGAAFLRDHPRSIGFITKKLPNNEDSSFYKPEEYSSVFFKELDKLKTIIQNGQDKIFYISQLGGGLANKHRIWQRLIRHNLVRVLKNYNNVVFCWNDSLVS
jgi:hypothetical protein